MSKIKVELINKEEVKDLYKYWSEFSATCYDTKINPEKPEVVGKHCHNTGHMSGSRAVYFMFKIEGISRACTAQMNRHSIGVVVNEQSMRYVDFSKKDIKIPPVIENDEYAMEIFNQAVRESKKAYQEIKERLIHLGRTGEQAKEDARYILPMGTETEGCWAFDIEALEHFCNIRLCNRAQWEIREVARQMKKQVLEVKPELKDKLVVNCLKMGYCPENRQQCEEFKESIITKQEFETLRKKYSLKSLLNARDEEER